TGTQTQRPERWHRKQYTWSESGYHLHISATPGTMAPEPIHLERIRLSSARQRNAFNKLFY
ncbi:hypothetical protein ACFFH5_11440, partial [Epilithonimonas hispanica]|uniref:hypothetical protein n=1 Tax=Epilithonimonas hispanica TaxID=358687 RepID=UPI0035EF86D5